MIIPTITHADALRIVAGNLREAINNGIPQSQSNKEIVDKFMAILNANAKNWQPDNTLWQMV